MKLPRKVKRYCPSCDEHTEQKADIVSTGHKRGTLKYGSLIRAKRRGALPGTGNKGRYSRRAVKSRKMKTKVTTKKVIVFTCQKCKKSNLTRSRRVGKIMFE